MRLITKHPLVLNHVTAANTLVPESEVLYRTSVPAGTYELTEIPNPEGITNVRFVITTFRGQRMGIALPTLQEKAEKSNGAMQLVQ
jgi:hypothetical protein